MDPVFSFKIPNKLNIDENVLKAAKEFNAFFKKNNN